MIRQRQLRYTSGSVLAAPPAFLILAILPDGASLDRYLTDNIAIGHRHDLMDGFPNLEEALNPYYDPLDFPPSPSSSASLSAPRDRTPYHPSSPQTPPVFPASELPALASAMENVTLTAAVRGYMQSIVVFLRTHHAVAPAGGGISPKATRQFEIVAKALATLHGLPYVTPDLVRLAAPKVYNHRLAIATVADERSAQWSTSPDEAAKRLEGWNAARVIENVLDTVNCPS